MGPVDGNLSICAGRSRYLSAARASPWETHSTSQKNVCLSSAPLQRTDEVARRATLCWCTHSNLRAIEELSEHEGIGSVWRHARCHFGTCFATRRRRTNLPSETEEQPTSGIVYCNALYTSTPCVQAAADGGRSIADRAPNSAPDRRLRSALLVPSYRR